MGTAERELILPVKRSFMGSGAVRSTLEGIAAPESPSASLRLVPLPIACGDRAIT
ncbi:hypothetical protein GCM10023232_17740 [Sphingosinicella ginsenosidimutans]